MVPSSTTAEPPTPRPAPCRAWRNIAPSATRTLRQFTQLCMSYECPSSLVATFSCSHRTSDSMSRTCSLGTSLEWVAHVGQQRLFEDTTATMVTMAAMAAMTAARTKRNWLFSRCEEHSKKHHHSTPKLCST